jgi:hypothetical protein
VEDGSTVGRITLIVEVVRASEVQLSTLNKGNIGIKNSEKEETIEVRTEEEKIEEETEIGSKTRNVNTNKKVTKKMVVTMITNTLKRSKEIITREEITKIQMIIIEMKIVVVIEENQVEITKIEEEVTKVVKVA